MLRSMTGFGRCVMEDADWTQTWEIRSVNNRHLDLKWRLPLQARGLESRLERVVRRFAARGASLPPIRPAWAAFAKP